MSMNKLTALVLRAGIVVGLVLIVIGLCATMTRGDDSILYAGILVLIASPFAGVIATFLCLLKERDWFWVLVAGILLAITCAGVVLSL